jgi:HD-GYP domain-containing protein (c-di-GMP phosphodiesterase class II)
MTPADAVAELRRNAGTQFDAGAVEALVRVLDEQSRTAESAASYAAEAAVA